MSKPKAYLQRGLFVPASWVQANPWILTHFTYTFKNKVDFGFGFENALVENIEIPMYRQVGEFVEFSRGDLTKIGGLFGEHFEIVDKRANVPLNIPLEFRASLRPTQKPVVRQFIDPNIGGIIQAPPGFGKTVVMCCLVSLLKMKTLLLVNKIDLKDQFMETVRGMTNLNELEAEAGKPLMGELSYDKNGNPVSFPITVSTYQLLIAGEGDERIHKIRDEFGLIMVDECHRSPAASLTKIILNTNPTLRIGVSATPKRKDKYHILLPDLIGPVRASSAIKGELEKVRIVKGVFLKMGRPNWTAMVGALLKNTARNKIILDKVVEDIEQGHRVCVLTERKEHCRTFNDLLLAQGIRSDYLTSDNPKTDEDATGPQKKAGLKSVEGVKARLNALDECIKLLASQTEIIDEWEAILTWEDLLPVIDQLSPELKSKALKIYENRLDCVVATSKLLGEGSDIPCLSSLHIVFPCANEVNYTQFIGRIQREFLRKRMPIVTYYADSGAGGAGPLTGCWKKFKKWSSETLKCPVEGPETGKMVDLDETGGLI